MERLAKRILPTVVALAAGLLVLAGYLVPHPLITFIRDQLIRWAVIVAAFAFILGFFNVLRVHLKRITRARPGAFYSGFLILSALASLSVTLAGLMLPSVRSLSDWWFLHVLSPLQASAGGLIALTLGLAAFRLLHSRRNAGALLFLFAAAVVLLGTLPLSGPAGERLALLRQWWMSVPATAGMRGLLIGVGLGTLLMGLRVLTGLDRPHSDL
ncbi:MAG TPA: hypothetical protein EYH30_02280 [Anaerolineales bacterium]|nr:hypothetical protein [Anaerolineae bacterium]HIQ00950.1 hypothetical protein [Anaerolineales bacterium]